jgi:hypothetical protein
MLAIRIHSLTKYLSIHPVMPQEEEKSSYVLSVIIHDMMSKHLLHRREPHFLKIGRGQLQVS